MSKMSRAYQRPENALKRANEFIDVAKPSRALEVLYEVIRRGKMRTTHNYSEKLLEPIMCKYLELCVDLKKSHLAKEGLYQYRNIFQSVNVSSLETVVKFYLKLADERTETARKESHQAVVDIDDLDNLATPEEILLSAVSGEDAQDRSDRTILTPWVKFLWESYRQCLELLRTNSRVEKLYHNIAQHAFKFCEKYNRKVEFRKLCDNLRMHLTHIQKQQGSATAVNLNNPETQQLNLETRLEQLNYAIKMELWQEAYKAIEDVSDLMKKSKKQTKPHVMASYYEKLALVFWKAGNHLFHAAALFKLFQLLRDQKKNITPEELTKRASVVLVVTLGIPLPSAHPEFDRFIETEKSALEKIDRLANLLSLPKAPTRASLIKDLIRFNVVSTVSPELQNLYQLMEHEFDPLHLCSRMQVHLDWIRERPESSLPQYITALQEMTITRLVKQIGQVYQTTTFKRLLELSVFMTPFHLEKILVDLVRHNDLQIRIDHRTNCIHFGVDMSESQREDLAEGPMLQTLPSETIRCQLVHMSSALQKCLTLIAPESRKKEMEPVRAQTIHLYNQTRAEEHEKILARQNIIEERKEMLENQNLEREEQMRKAQEEQIRRQKDEEQDRLRREASKREKERQEEQLKQIHTKQIKDKLLQISKTSYGQKMIEKIDKEELYNLGTDGILQRQVEELERERKELQKKLKVQEKSVDFFERARKLLEIPRLKKMLEHQKEKDKDFWEVQEQERITKMIDEHDKALEHSKRLKRMVPDRNEFMEKLKTARHSEVENKMDDFNARVEVERKTRLLERKEQRRLERREAFYRQKEEEEQLRRDEELKRQREDEEMKELERSKQEEEEEEEREARRKGELERSSEKRGEGQRQISDLDRNGDVNEDSSGPWRPKRASAWRQKEQEKEDAWRVKEEGGREPLSEMLANRDIRRDEPRVEESRNDWRTGSSWDTDKDRETKSGPPHDRDNERGPPKDRDMDFDRGPPRDRDFDRGPPRDRDRDFERGTPRDRDRDFERGPPRDRDRDFQRGPPRDRDRDFERGPPRDRDRDSGPPRNRDRDLERGPHRNSDFDRREGGGRFGDREKDSDFSRGGSSSWRRSEPESKGEGSPWRGGQNRDLDRDRDFKRDTPRDRDFEKGHPRDRDRDLERGPPRNRDRDFERGPPRDRDFERGPPRDRDFERGPPRDRDFERGPPRDRDFERGPPRDRDFERGPPRDRDIERGPPMDMDRRPPPRGGDRDLDRRERDSAPPKDGGESWRKGEPATPRDGSKKSERNETPQKTSNPWRRGGPSDDAKDEPKNPWFRRDEGKEKGSSPNPAPKHKEDSEVAKEEPKKEPKKPPRDTPDEEGWMTVRR